MGASQRSGRPVVPRVRHGSTLGSVNYLVMERETEGPEGRTVQSPRVVSCRREVMSSSM